MKRCNWAWETCGIWVTLFCRSYKDGHLWEGTTIVQAQMVQRFPPSATNLPTCCKGINFALHTARSLRRPCSSISIFRMHSQKRTSEVEITIGESQLSVHLLFRFQVWSLSCDVVRRWCWFVEVATRSWGTDSRRLKGSTPRLRGATASLVDQSPGDSHSNRCWNLMHSLGNSFLESLPGFMLWQTFGSFGMISISSAEIITKLLCSYSSAEVISDTAIAPEDECKYLMQIITWVAISCGVNDHPMTCKAGWAYEKRPFPVDLCKATTHSRHACSHTLGIMEVGSGAYLGKCFGPNIWLSDDEKSEGEENDDEEGNDELDVKLEPSWPMWACNSADSVDLWLSAGRLQDPCFMSRTRCCFFAPVLVHHLCVHAKPTSLFETYLSRLLALGSSEDGGGPWVITQDNACLVPVQVRLARWTLLSK